jgi:PKD repeat protein
MNFMQVAQSSGSFEFSLRLEGSAVAAYAQQNGCDVTTELIKELNYVASTFYGSPAYSRIAGRPVMYFFGVESYYVDWNRVRASIAGNPIFVMRNKAAFTDPATDGGFSWLQTNATNANDEMLSYLDGFYTAAQSSSKLAVGSIYKGFNDTLASWSANRIINQQCGLTWLDSFSEAGKYYSSSKQLESIQIVTWNDYEEGTEIETGIDNCAALAPTVSGSTLSWSIGSKASERTIDHYTVFISTDGQNLMRMADVAAGSHSLDLSQYDLATATYVLYVKAVGKASIVNHMSPAVAYNPHDQAPIASLSVNPASGAAPLTVSASSANSSDPDGTITNAKIDFGDGTVLSGGAGFGASHTYHSRGTYPVALTVVDNAGVFSITQQTVTVAAGPGVTITSPGSGASVQSPVHLVATGSIAGGVSYMEIFVDNATSPAYSAIGPFIDTSLQIAAGTHTLRVVAHDTTPAANFIYSDVSFTVGANDAPPLALLDVDPFGGGNQVMACTAASTDSDGFISGSKINFGDGVIASGPTALHTYASGGTYQVTATVRDNAGLSSTASSAVTVGNASSLSGAVTNVKTGSPLAGAKVSLGGTTTSADSNGHYGFSNVSQGTYLLTASASGYLARNYNVTVTAGNTATQNIALSTAGVLQGKVSNGSGGGVAGATVSISGGSLSSSFSVTASSTGGYTFGWIPVGTYAVAVTASGYGSSSANATINTGQTTTLNVSLSSGAAASISGRVTSAADGHALAGATVSKGSATTTTDSSGNYSFSSVAAGSYTLTASSTGRLPASATISVTAGSQLVHNFQLSTAGVLKGKVSTSGGSGLAGVRVTFTGGVFNATNSVVTDASGNYNAGYIPIGKYAVSVTASGVTKTSSASVFAGATSMVNFTF